MTELAPINILLLEDDEAFAMALSIGLAKKQCQLTHVATSAALEVELEASSAERFDLVLLDLKLAHETSLAYIQTVRQALPNSKIFMVTGFASIATTVEAIKLGADDYLPKPVNVADILRAYYGTQGVDVKLPNAGGKLVQGAESELISPKRLEWEYIQRTLQENDGNVSRTAKQLNMHRRTLQRKLQKKPTQN